MGLGLGWISPLGETKTTYSHIVIHTFIAAVMKDDVLKNLAPLRAFYFDVSNIRKSVKKYKFTATVRKSIIYNTKVLGIPY